MRVKDGKVLKTVGELKRSLVNMPDDTPLAFADMSPGYGMAKPYVSNRAWSGSDGVGYYRKDEPANSNVRELSKAVCVIEPAV